MGIQLFCDFRIRPKGTYFLNDKTLFELYKYVSVHAQNSVKIKNLDLKKINIQVGYLSYGDIEN